MNENKENMTTTLPITTETLFEFLKEFKLDVNKRFDGVDKRLDSVDERLDSVDKRLDSVDKRLDGVDERLDSVDKRLDSVDKRLDGVDKRLDGVDKRLDDVYERLDYMGNLIKTEKHDRERMNNKLEEIYECRNRVAISFTRSWMIASIFIALLSATVVLAVEKAF